MPKEIYVGLHYYCKYGRNYAVYVYDQISKDGKSGSAGFVSEHRTQEEARREVYRLNGWGTPKSTLTHKSLERQKKNLASIPVVKGNL